MEKDTESKGRPKTRIDLLEESMDREFSLDQTNTEKATDRLACINKLYPNDYSFEDPLPPGTIDYHKPTFSDLRAQYCEVAVRKQKRKNGIEITHCETSLFDLVKRHTRKHVERSFLVGTYFLDLFIPNVRSSDSHLDRTMRGLNIEVDGDSHYYESKMKKDGKKRSELQCLGIASTSIPNPEVRRSSSIEICKDISRWRTLDSRERRRLWRKIWAFTLAVNLSDEVFFKVFKPKRLGIGA
jgi:hypothetical protein